MPAEVEDGSASDSETNSTGSNMYKVLSILKNYSAGKVTLKNAIALFAEIGIEQARAREMLLDVDEGEEELEDIATDATQGAGNSDNA